MLHGLQGEPLRVEVFRLHSKGTGTLHTVSGKVAGVRQGALLLTGLAVDPIAPYAQEWARQGIPLGEIVALHTPDGRKVEWARLNAITADIANHN